MSDSDDGQSQGQFYQLIVETRYRMQQARNQYWEELGHVSDATHRRLAVALLQYHDVLMEHSDHSETIEEDWKESKVEQVRDLLGQTTPQAVDAPGDTQANDYVQRPAVLEVDAETLISISKDLDNIAAKLDFTASVTESTPRTEITDEMIEEVEEWRQQNLS
jgi:hypothetical protein